jgi:hypothetical protein
VPRQELDEAGFTIAPRPALPRDLAKLIAAHDPAVGSAHREHVKAVGFDYLSQRCRRQAIRSASASGTTIKVKRRNYNPDLSAQKLGQKVGAFERVTEYASLCFLAEVSVLMITA